MRIAVLNDVHGNLPALEAVLDEVSRAGVTAVVVGGDVLPGPMPRETLNRLQALPMPVHFLYGNGETDVLAARRGEEITRVPDAFRGIIRWAAEQLTPGDVGALEQWPATVRLHIDGIGEVLFCHATPLSDNAIFTVRTPEEQLLPIFERLGVAMVVCGHTHMPFDRIIGGTRVVNAGSVGMPFGPAGADWLLLGPDVELRHTAYDVAAAAARIRATAYPHADAFAEKYVLNPPTTEQMLAAFSGV
jgi:putative phosphoesterase